MKTKVYLFAAILFASTFAHATPLTSDFLCGDNKGNALTWDVQNYAIYDAGGLVEHIHSELHLEIDGRKYSLPTDTALATPDEPLLLLKGEDSQYVIIKPAGPTRREDGQLKGSADVELMVKGPRGPIEKKFRVKCRAFNDV